MLSSVVVILIPFCHLGSFMALLRVNKEINSKLQKYKNDIINKLQWRIITEYHLKNYKYKIHEIRAEIGDKQYDSPCEYCCKKKWNENEDNSVGYTNKKGFSVFSSDIKRNFMSGVGGETLHKMIKNIDHVPIWYEINYEKETISPVGINSVVKKKSYYYDEVALSVNVNTKCNPFIKITTCIKNTTENGINPKHLLDISLDFDYNDYKRRKY